MKKKHVNEQQNQKETKMKTIKTSLFVDLLNDGFYSIVRNKDGSLELIDSEDDFDGATKIDELMIGNPVFTTYRLRQYCAEFHPEIDFDKEFETDTPGVFARYQDRFGFDYADWAKNENYKDLEEELKARGYKLLPD